MGQQETWKDIRGYAGRYIISNYGRVISFARSKEGRELSLRPSRENGRCPHYKVCLSLDKECKETYVHSIRTRYILTGD